MELFRKKRPRPGSAPGSLHTDSLRPSAAVRLSVVDYAAGHFEEASDLSIDEARPYLASPNNTWLHVQGDPDPELLHTIGEAYDLHPLAIADVINGGQRTKYENYPNQHFIVLQHPKLTDDVLESDQISLFIGANYVISFHGGSIDIFEPIRARLRKNPEGRLRTSQCDYLLYALIDLVVDSSFPVLETLGEQLEKLEDQVLENPERETLDDIHLMKRELILLRRAQWPQRELLNNLIRDEHGFVQDSTKLYLRDCYDHTIQVMDLIENYREMSSGLLDVYLSSVSNRMNDVMKVLTVISTIFHSPVLSGRCLRHELRHISEPLEYARARVPNSAIRCSGSPRSASPRSCSVCSGERAGSDSQGSMTASPPM